MSRLRQLAGRAWRAARHRLGNGPRTHEFSLTDLTATGLLDAAVARDLAACEPYTLTSTERLLATSDAVEYVVRRGVPGALVECGVWKGGSVLAMLLALKRMGVADREIWLYDTFEGMTAPTEHDTSAIDRTATETWAEAQASGRRAWSEFFAPEVFGLEQVRNLLLGTGYPEQLIHFVAGPVETTLPAAIPEQVAVLRLDTDWYESTRHELVHLYPRLSPGGVLVIDDYGHWEGARKAVDEYLAEQGEALLLQRTDYTGRMAVKGG